MQFPPGSVSANEMEGRCLPFHGFHVLMSECAHPLRMNSTLATVVWSLSHVWLFATPWTVARQAPLSMGFPRQENWSGLPFPFPGESSQARIEPTSPGWQADCLLLSYLGSPLNPWLVLTSSDIYWAPAVWRVLWLQHETGHRLLTQLLPQGTSVGRSTGKDCASLKMW